MSCLCALTRHPLRISGRLMWLGAEMALAAMRFFFWVALSPQRSPLTRARWLQRSSVRVLRVFGVEFEAHGATPETGLLICNHLSYLDVLALAAITPAVFVAKREVKQWPLLGWFARLAGTVFVDRQKRSQVGAANEEIATALNSGVLTVLFPEGTSSDGQTVLPFKSALLEPAIAQTCPVWAGLIEYRLAEGDPGEEVCYWRDMTFLPHLINLLSKAEVQTRVRFAAVKSRESDRKSLARRMHSEVLRLRQEPVPTRVPENLPQANYCLLQS